ncbi:MAG: phosphodiester glycosidase family protein [Solobacterium sp.]|nr:phosphodiester glycosidase family protein [Solobacterium sp.]MBR3203702.1 phosphodiester glycosidase family protein [Solobacterium sp.]
MAKKKKKKSGMSLLALVLLCILTAAIALLATEYFYMKEKYAGSAVAYSHEQIRDLDVDSMEYKIVKLFYTEDQLENIRDNTVSVDETAQTTAGNAQQGKDIEIVPIHGSTYEGYMMLVHNPSDISVAVNPYLGSGAAAPSLDEYVSMYHALAGINGGGFQDDGGHGNGSIPQGVVIHEGKLVYGNANTYLGMVGITKDGKLFCANATGNECLEWGVQEAVTFGPVFINNYQVVFKEGTDNLGMLNPRTAIGQRSDGTFMLLVIDGRGPTSFGALYEDVIKIFQENDAVNAANLDGGNSSAMIYDGNYVNTPVSMYGSRNLPTVFLVKGDN